MSHLPTPLPVSPSSPLGQILFLIIDSVDFDSKERLFMTAASALKPKDENLSLILIAYFSFLVMGMPIAIIGILWTPYMQETFGLPLSAVSAYYVAWTVGYFIASFISGRLTARFGSGTLMTISCVISALALAGVAAAPSWTLLVACAVLFGVSTGIQDGGLNIIFAARYNARLMNLLHACFGIGTFLSPLLAAILLNNGFDWRASYAVMGVLFAVAAALYFTTRNRWDIPSAEAEVGQKPAGSLLAALRLPMVWVGMGMFFLIAAAESTAGNWASPLLESRTIDLNTAAIWVSLYWLSFTVGRLFFGLVNFSLSPENLLRVVAVTGIFGGWLYWWNPFPAANLIALLIMGFSVAPMFPFLVTSTEARLGSSQAANAIGMQIAGASVGVGVMPGLAGVLADSFGLQIVPPFVLALFIGFFLLLTVALQMGKAKRA
jgi:fucose permease